MATKFRISGKLGKVALYDEAPGGGSHSDVHSPRNRPFLDPENWLGNIYFHSDLDNMEVAFDQTVSVAHAGVGTRTDSGSYAEVAGRIVFNAYHKTTTLLTHRLGYVPHVMVAVGKMLITPSYPVQTLADGRGRFVTVSVDEQKVVLSEWVSATHVALPAITVKYRVLVFRKPPAPSGREVARIGRGKVRLARGRFDFARAYLQVVPKGSPFALASGKTIDLKNGAPRFVRPDGTVYDPVPATMKMSVGSASQPGGAMNYTGSFKGTAPILVSVP